MLIVSTQDGAAGCILANEAFVHDIRLENQAIELVMTGLATDYPNVFAGRSAIETVCFRMTVMDAPLRVQF